MAKWPLAGLHWGRRRCCANLTAIAAGSMSRSIKMKMVAVRFVRFRPSRVPNGPHASRHIRRNFWPSALPFHQVKTGFPARCADRYQQYQSPCRWHVRTSARLRDCFASDTRNVPPRGWRRRSHPRTQPQTTAHRRPKFAARAVVQLMIAGVDSITPDTDPQAGRVFNPARPPVRDACRYDHPAMQCRHKPHLGPRPRITLRPQRAPLAFSVRGALIARWPVSTVAPRTSQRRPHHRVQSGACLVHKQHRP